MRGVRSQALPLSRPPALQPGCRGPLPMCCERGVRVWGPSTVPLACTPCEGCVLRGWWGAIPWWPATVVRGVLCPWALSLPRSPALWGGQPGIRDPCAPGAVGAGVGTRHRPHSARPCGLAWRTVGVVEWRPQGGAFTVVTSVARRRNSPGCLPSRRAVGVRHPLAVGAGCGCGGPAWLACPVGAACRGACGGRPPGGVACHRCEGRLVSGAVPPPAACPLGRAAGVPRPDQCVPGAVGAGVGTQHRSHSVRPCGLALLAVGVAEGRPRGGAYRCCVGRLRSGAPPLPVAPHSPGGLLGSVTHVLRASGVRRCPSPSRPSSGAVSRGSTTRVSRVRSVRAWGSSTGPTACALAGRRCSLWGLRRGFPEGGAFHCCEGRLRSGAPPPPTAGPPGGLSGYLIHLLWARVCGCGGPALSPRLACPPGAARRVGGGEPSPGGGRPPPL